MRTPFLLAIFSIGSAFPFISTHAEGGDYFVPFWYAGASVAYNDGRQINDEPSLCDGLNGLIDGIHLGHQFSPYLMTEVEYQYLGCMTTLDQLNSDMRQGVVSAKLGYPITENMTPYLKVGAAGWTGAGANGIASVMGVGVSYRALDNLALNVEYQYSTPVGNEAIGEFNHQRLSLGIQYRFGYAKPQIITIEKPVVREVIVEQVIEKIIEIEKAPLIETVVATSLNAQTALFENNSSILVNANALLPVVDLLKEHLDATVRITGHTDSIGAELYNQSLSVKRATAVRDHLVNQGINETRIVAKGKGELEPVESNDTISGREMNRRVVIEFN